MKLLTLTLEMDGQTVTREVQMKSDYEPTLIMEIIEDMADSLEESKQKLINDLR